MKTLLSALFLTAAPLLAQTTATVSDPVSPGILGDTVLSIDEAIQLVNGTLMVSQLSAAEAAQVNGTGQPTEILIDHGVTPLIQVRQTPTPLDGPAVGVDVAIRGVNGLPFLEISSVSLGLRIRTSNAEVTGLRIAGGVDGIHADASVHFVQGRQIKLAGLDFLGQAGTATRFTADPMRMTMARIEHTSFRVCNTAITQHDRGMMLMMDVEFCSFESCLLGVDMFTAGSGNMTMNRQWRCKMSDCRQLADVQRDPASDKRSMLMWIAGSYQSNGKAIDAVGTALVETAVHIHASEITVPAGQQAFRLGDLDSRIDYHVSECVFTGDVHVQEGRLNRRLWAWNNVFRNGLIEVENLGAPTSFRWNRFENCTVRATAGNRSRFEQLSSEFYDSRIEGLSSLGPVDLQNCFLSNTTTSGSVNNSSPAPSPWLARTSCSDDSPSIGGTVDLTLDLPPGMLGVWVLGVSDPRLVLTQEPWRDYAFHAPTLQIPGIYALHSTLRITIPDLPALVGQEIYAQPITGPVAGQTHVPAFNLPRGAHLTIGE